MKPPYIYLPDEKEHTALYKALWLMGYHADNASYERDIARMTGNRMAERYPYIFVRSYNDSRSVDMHHKDCEISYLDRTYVRMNSSMHFLAYVQRHNHRFQS